MKNTDVFFSQATFDGETRQLNIGRAGLPLTVHRPLCATGFGRGPSALPTSASGAETNRTGGQATSGTQSSDSTSTKGIVILVPGWSGPRSGPAEILVLLATRLAQLGYCAVRLDLPGRGDATGDFAACDLDLMIEAVTRTVAEYAENNNECLLLGMCSGGNVSLGAATRMAEQFPRIKTRVIALSTLPFQPARTKKFDQRRRWKNIKQYARKILSPSTWLRLIRGEINLGRVKKNVTAQENVPTLPGAGINLKDSKRDIEKELLVWKQDALFIWGSGDEEAALARKHFETLHANGMCETGRAKFHTIDGANHNFYAKAWREEIMRNVEAFLENRS